MHTAGATLAELRNFLQTRAIPFTENEPLFSYTSFRLGGNADIFVTPQSADALAELQSWLLKTPVPVFLLGGVSNLLISDNGMRISCDRDPNLRCRRFSLRLPGPRRPRRK